MLQTRLQSCDVAAVDLDKSVLICSTVAMKSMHSVWRGYTAMLLVMKLAILITMGMTSSVKQTTRGCSIVKTDYLTH